MAKSRKTILGRRRVVWYAVAALLAVVLVAILGNSDEGSDAARTSQTSLVSVVALGA